MIVENPVLLVFNMIPAKEAAVAKVASSMHIECRHVEANDMNTPLGALAQAKNWFVPAAVPASSGSSSKEELLIMCGLEDKQLDMLLKLLRASMIQIPLKAILTETNAMWNAAQITAELISERDEILRRLK